MKKIAVTFFSTFAVLALIYIFVLGLVWKAFESQREKVDQQKQAAGGAAAAREGEEDQFREEEAEEGGPLGDADMLPPLGDLSYEGEHTPIRSPPSRAQHNRRKFSFTDNLDAAMSRPMPQKHRAPPRPSMDLVHIEDAQPAPAPPRQKRGRRLQQPQQQQPLTLQQESAMDEVIRDMNSKSGITRTAAAETKVVYPNADATYGAEPTSTAQANSIMLSPEERIMIAHKASVGLS